MSRKPKENRHPSSGCPGFDQILDRLTPDGHAACLLCLFLPFIAPQIAKRTIASLHSRIGEVDLGLSKRAEARRQAILEALRKAHAK